MMYMRAHTIRTRQGGHGRRGSVIVLVVAVLALLAVIGTVYIVSARSELGGAAASANATNLDNAQKAVNDIVTQTIGDALLDGRGTIGGPATAGPFGSHAPRTADMPEGNPAAFYLTPPLPFTASYSLPTLLERDESWLADSVYRYNSTYFNPYLGVYYGIGPATPGAPPADARYNSVSLLTPFLFNPSDGLYDIPVYNNAPGYFPTFGSLNMFHVVADASMMPQSAVMPNGATINSTPTTPVYDADSYINLLPFSDASGVRYRFGIRIVDTSALANLNAGTVYNSPPGASYARMVNNNVYYNAYALNAPSIFNSSPAPFRSTADIPSALTNSTAGRLGAWAPFFGIAPQEYIWEQAIIRFERPDLAQTTPFDPSDELELRSYGYLGTLATPRAASAATGGIIWPNTLGNRVVTPTPSATVSGNANRGFYTAYSYSRALRPIADPVNAAGISTAYEIAPQNGWFSPPPGGPASTGVWPLYPAPVAANPDISGYTVTVINNEQAVEAIAVAANNIATAMELPALIGGPGYSPSESHAFAANYLTTRWNSWTTYRQPKTIAVAGGGTATYPVYTMPAGPSFIDPKGICVRTGAATSSNGNFSGPAATVLDAPANQAYLGFAAQPFINEVAILTQSDPNAVAPAQPWNEVDCAVELYNPFDEAISLQDFALSFDGSTPIDFTDTSGTKDQWVPPRGYFVVTANTGTGNLDNAPYPTIPTTAVHIDAGHLGTVQTMLMHGKTTLYLLRRYYDRSGNKQWAAVDQYGIKNIADLTNATNYPPPQPTDTPQAQVLFENRPNLDDTSSAAQATATALSRWVATVHDVANLNSPETPHKHDGSTPATTLSLGSKNDSAGAVAPNKYVPLYDKTLELYSTNGGTADRLPLDNAADFGRIMRITNEFNPTSGTPGVSAGNGAMSVQLASKIAASATDTSVQNSDFPAEAEVRFDFRPNLSQWGAASSGGPRPGDQRAATLLQCLSFTDRVSDYTIDLGDNNTFLTTPTGIVPNRGISKLRIPGKINVNTAGPEVLFTIPVLNTNPQLIGAILAYRMRTTTADPRIPTALQTTGTPADFSSQTMYPGYGIRSIGELEIPITAYWQANAATINSQILAPSGSPAPVPTSLYGRQALWGSMSNTLTTRSDTFVLYAYLEAVKMNPRYNGTPFLSADGVTAHTAIDNATDWYLNTTGAIGAAITDDPNNPTAPLLRLARRRWVAIIDRSSNNYSRYVEIPGTPPGFVLDPRFAQPKIVAAKDLPQ